jgi:hypothetical protein
MPIIQLESGEAPSYIEAGARWFEMNTPLNLPEGGAERSKLAGFLEGWLQWATSIIKAGGYPAFPVLAASAEPEWATLTWARAMYDYLHTYHQAHFLYIVANGLWFPVETHIQNRFYQQLPSGPSHTARRYYQTSEDESGWHFEHPYDPIQQVMDRGRTVLGGTEDTPHGAPHGVIGTAQMMQDLLNAYFDVGPVPVIATRGGMWPVLQPEDDAIQPHPAYPPIDHSSQVRASIALLEWLTRRGPPWFWGMLLRTEQDYYDESGIHRLMERWAAFSPLEKHVPNVETGGLMEPPTELTEEAGSILTQLDDAPLEGVTDEDTLMGLLAVEEPVFLEPGEEPEPDVDILAALEPMYVPDPPGFVDARAFTAALENQGPQRALEAFKPEPIRDQPPREEGHAFFAMLDDYIETGSSADDGLTALERFDQMLASDGTDSIIMPADEREAPDFFDIVEELTGERPHAASPALQGRKHFLYIAEPNSITLDDIRPYWEAFRPTLLTDVSLLAYIPQPVVTLIAPREAMEDARQRVQATAPQAKCDMIALERLTATLNVRIREQRRYELS